MKEPNRRHLPDIRPSITSKASHTSTYGNYDIYVTVGFYDTPPADRSNPGEVFVKVAKHGSEISTFMDGWAQMVSISLQYGVPWEKIRDKFINYSQPTLIESVVRAIDDCIKERKKVIGED